MYGIWESNLPFYFLPSVNIFPEIIHLCDENNEPTQRAVKSPSGSILFHINPDSINQMLNFKQTQLLTPFSMKYLLDEGPKLSSFEIARITKTFMRAYWWAPNLVTFWAHLAKLSLLNPSFFITYALFFSMFMSFVRIRGDTRPWWLTRAHFRFFGHMLEQNHADMS